jgi:hypothetical protein
MKVQKHQELFLKTTKEYSRQMNQVLNMVEKANPVQIRQLLSVSKKLKSSLQKLNGQQGVFKRYVNNAAKYTAMLQPYIDLLEETRAELEKIGVKP